MFNKIVKIKRLDCLSILDESETTLRASSGVFGISVLNQKFLGSSLVLTTNIYSLINTLFSSSKN